MTSGSQLMAVEDRTKGRLHYNVLCRRWMNRLTFTAYRFTTYQYSGISSYRLTDIGRWAPHERYSRSIGLYMATFPDLSYLSYVSINATVVQPTACVLSRVGKNLGLWNIFLVFQKFFLGFLIYKCRTQNYDPQVKIRPCEHHKSQLIFEYHLS